MFNMSVIDTLKISKDLIKAGLSKDVAEELALRATERGAINTHALHSVLRVLQQLAANRST